MSCGRTTSPRLTPAAVTASHTIAWLAAPCNKKTEWGAKSLALVSPMGHGEDSTLLGQKGWGGTGWPQALREAISEGSGLSLSKAQGPRY